MLRLLGLALAGTAITAAGCTLPIGNTGVQVTVKANEQVINQNVEVVAQKIETELKRLGLDVIATTEGDTIRLASMTRAGQKFTVFVNREQAQRGDQTRVRVEWEQTPDAALWTQLVSAVLLSQAPGTTTAGR
jgi:hypothetical protein